MQGSWVEFSISWVASGRSYPAYFRLSDCRNYSKKVRQKLAKTHFGTLSLHTENPRCRTVFQLVRTDFYLVRTKLGIGAHQSDKRCAPIEREDNSIPRVEWKDRGIGCRTALKLLLNKSKIVTEQLQDCC